MLKSNYDQSTNTLTFIFAGHLDTASCLPMSKELESKVAESSAVSDKSGMPLKIVFDLKDVDFISSAFIRICMIILSKVKAGDLSVRNANPFIKKTIKISGLENQLNLT